MITRPFADGDGYAVESTDFVPKICHRKISKVSIFQSKIEVNKGDKSMNKYCNYRTSQ